MDEAKLFRIRVALIQAFLQKHGYDGVLFSRCDNYAMVTGGKRNYVYTYGDAGANAIFITAEGRAFLISNTIEAQRQKDEELENLPYSGSVEFLWFEKTPAEVVREKFKGNFCSDDGSLGPNVHSYLAAIRAALTEFELEKYRHLGKLAAEAMTHTIMSIERGMTEFEIASNLVHEGWKRHCHVPVALVAADDRISRYRHPLPTIPSLVGQQRENRVCKYVMVVGCFLREGLVVSMTRFKQVDDIPETILDAQRRISAVDIVLQEETSPGKTLGDVFAKCQDAYKAFGFSPKEWHNHHQGGATGYAGRTCKGAPGEQFRVIDPEWAQDVKRILGEDVPFGMAFAWNPSAPGVKSEDTFILLPDGEKEIVTRTPVFHDIDVAAVLGRPTTVVKSGFAS